MAHLARRHGVGLLVEVDVLGDHRQVGVGRGGHSWCSILRCCHRRRVRVTGDESQEDAGGAVAIPRADATSAGPAPPPCAPVASFDVADDAEAEQFGPNAWLVEEMYERFRADPSSVSQNWQEFFADYRSAAPNGRGAGPGCHTGGSPVHRGDRACPRRRRTGTDRPARPTTPETRSAVPAPPSSPTWSAASVCPTATSFRNVPAKPARGQPPGHQRLPRPQGRRQGQLHAPHRLRRGAGHRRRRARHEQRLRRGRRRQAPRRTPRAREHGPGRRRRRSPTAAARSSCPCCATPTP